MAAAINKLWVLRKKIIFLWVLRRRKQLFKRKGSKKRMWVRKILCLSYQMLKLPYVYTNFRIFMHINTIYIPRQARFFFCWSLYNGDLISQMQGYAFTNSIKDSLSCHGSSSLFPGDVAVLEAWARPICSCCQNERQISFFLVWDKIEKWSLFLSLGSVCSRWRCIDFPKEVSSLSAIILSKLIAMLFLTQPQPYKKLLYCD